MQPIFLYPCRNPDCFTAFVRGSKIRAKTKQRCHACGEPLPEMRVYVAGPQREVPAKAFGGSE